MKKLFILLTLAAPLVHAGELSCQKDPNTDQGIIQNWSCTYQGTDLDAAYPSIALLPTAARAGVLAAYLIFRDLCARLDHMTMSEIMSTRVRVPAMMKARLVARACAQAPRLHPPTM